MKQQSSVKEKGPQGLLSPRSPWKALQGTAELRCVYQEPAGVQFPWLRGRMARSRTGAMEACLFIHEMWMTHTGVPSSLTPYVQREKKSVCA